MSYPTPHHNCAPHVWPHARALDDSAVHGCGNLSFAKWLTNHGWGDVPTERGRLSLGRADPVSRISIQLQGKRCADAPLAQWLERWSYEP
jgi:hypothetical protein